MAVDDQGGRIDKQPLLISTGVFFALAIVGVIVRCVLRFRVQKQKFQLDDGVLLLATAFLVASTVAMYDKTVYIMYLVEAIALGRMEVPANMIELSDEDHKWTMTTLMLIWCAICAVKFFFLVFFRKLIDRLRVWQIYWWFACLFNLGLWVFGVVAFWATCPHLGAAAMECNTPKYLGRLTAYTASKVAVDIVSDILILAIPVAVIWKVRVDWTQKLALAGSLCIDVVQVGLSIARAAGLEHDGRADGIFEMYTLFISAALGVFLAAATAFRPFIMAKKRSKAYTPPYSRWPNSISNKRKAGSDRSRGSGWSGQTPTPTAGDFQRLAPDGKDSDSRREDLEWHAMSSTNSSATHCAEGACDYNMADDSAEVTVVQPVSVLKHTV
ncbi:hypothetical protein ANOM_002096 [Aspergillus nomiae NRRL 13137]|uniref:Rhodopsin domain-containing protein n=1 Tax=Aspergillus nomiae NRRL (strain ATCC 15546 / NRRL 13137 / CBS 260.88 / M93) TaxID=1509407 RepID=A0A0L1JEG7_ASPN3|nr:uncharacterized protein ANOM_002096 [Aspergillus nomiae NRRL 13137]KNG90106.1 hypothetical protein ANOM_002096 [Aspergillus nomiae NRRL 13137]